MILFQRFQRKGQCPPAGAVGAPSSPGFSPINLRSNASLPADASALAFTRRFTADALEVCDKVEWEGYHLWYLLIVDKPETRVVVEMSVVSRTYVIHHEHLKETFLNVGKYTSGVSNSPFDVVFYGIVLELKVMY